MTLASAASRIAQVLITMRSAASIVARLGAAGREQPPGHLLRVAAVHLAAEGPDVEARQGARFGAELGQSGVVGLGGRARRARRRRRDLEHRQEASGRHGRAMLVANPVRRHLCRTTGELGEVSATGVSQAEMRALTMKSGTVARFVATGSSTRGDFGLYRWEMPADTGGATGHFHRTFSESFYVLDGNPSFFDGEAWTARRAGLLPVRAAAAGSTASATIRPRRRRS